jgi:hypothetical protein
MLYHQVYSMLSVLVAAFDPVSKGLRVKWILIQLNSWIRML